MDIASSIQHVTEEIILRMARHVYKETGYKRLCLAGGVALNCVANARVLKEIPFEMSGYNQQPVMQAVHWVRHCLYGTSISKIIGLPMRQGIFRRDPIWGQYIQTKKLRNTWLKIVFHSKGRVMMN